ncbi:ABC transporter permease [Cellulomonas triticagri]|uniref:Transport permease protein n=1 Tax=Cellulomonas triticagri TaxID=2483352 RepID=A0A3M2JKN9_9CELL|nr:ABC transporter permease [Cellulomonas triticagri]RMI13684.1 ABC transporter permease [Cellulomonas triticagri]
MTADLTGADRAAPAARRVLAQARFETLAVLRNGEQLLVTLIIPVVALLALGRSSFLDVGTGDAARIDVVTPGVLGLAVMAGSMTSQAIATAFDRRNGVLRLLATTPLGRSGMLAGKALAVLVVATLQVVAVAATGLALGWRPEPAGLPAALLALVLGVAAFTALALLLAGTLRAEAVLAVANLLLVVLAVVGGVVLPVADLPSWWAAVAQWLPPGALGEALRGALVDGAFPAAHLAALAAWTLVLAAAVRRWFRWT